MTSDTVYVLLVAVAMIAFGLGVPYAGYVLFLVSIAAIMDSLLKE